MSALRPSLHQRPHGNALFHWNAPLCCVATLECADLMSGRRRPTGNLWREKLFATIAERRGVDPRTFYKAQQRGGCHCCFTSCFVPRNMQWAT